MANVTRFDPFRELLSVQDQLFKAFDRSYGRGPASSAEENLSTATWSPAVDIFENQDGILLKVELPEVEAKDVDLQIEGNTLTLRGERKLERAEERGGYHRIERSFGQFMRSFTLPSSVDIEHISAESKDGVLRIVLPRRPETKPRQIKVQVEAARANSAGPAEKQ